MKTRVTRTAIEASMGEREKEGGGGSRMRERRSRRDREAKAVAQHVHGIRLGVPGAGWGEQGRHRGERRVILVRVSKSECNNAHSSTTARRSSRCFMSGDGLTSASGVASNRM